MFEESLAGPIGIFVKFSTLQDHGVDKVFLLENDNVDASQKNIIFLARGEKAKQPIAIAGMYVLYFLHPLQTLPVPVDTYTCVMYISRKSLSKS